MLEKIKEIINNHSGVSGVIIKDSDENMITINQDEVFPSASIIKLFILLMIKEEDFNKEIIIKKEDKVGGCGILKVLKDKMSFSIKDIAYLMICLSDNTATNILIDYLGMNNINSFIQENGFTNTSLERKMMDSEAKLAGKDNYTSPLDTLKALELLCDEEEKLEMLKNQASKNKISLYFPRDFVFAHKTGELESIEHDAGRMYFEDKWVDVVILTKNLKDNSDGIKINSLIGQMIFEEYN